MVRILKQSMTIVKAEDENQKERNETQHELSPMTSAFKGYHEALAISFAVRCHPDACDEVDPH